jgi:hypothetical protein
MGFRDFFRAKLQKQPETARPQTEWNLVEMIMWAATQAVDKIEDFVPRGTGTHLRIRIYFEYLFFLLHMTNRLASKSASWQEVDQMYRKIAPLAIEVSVQRYESDFQEFQHLEIPEQPWQEMRNNLYDLLETREKEYAKSKE